MKMSESQMSDFNQLFGTNEYLFKVGEFGVSHSSLRISLEDTSTPVPTVLDCVLCNRLVLPVHGGPVQLRLSYSGDCLVTLSSDDKSLTVLCSAVQWPRSASVPFQRGAPATPVEVETTALNSLNTFLRGEDGCQVVVVHFDADEACMRLALHHNTYPKHKALTCVGCVSMAVDVFSGPHNLRVKTLAGGHVELYAEDGTFSVVCESVVRSKGAIISIDEKVLLHGQ